MRFALLLGMRRLLLILLITSACGTEVELATTDDEGTGRGPTWSSSPGTITLSRKLFKHTPQDFDLDDDKDQDQQLDRMEYELAQRVVPFVYFSQYEDGRLSHEPVTLFQVIPADCTGEGCKQILKKYKSSSGETYKYRVRVRFGFLWEEDTGYMGTEGSWACGLDTHDGDSQSITIELVSKDGISWLIERYDLGGTFMWPDNAAQFRNNHPVLYFSAGKHHHFLDTTYNDEDSPYSDHGCNDLIDAHLGFEPNLVSAYSDERPNNVGEYSHHSGLYFIHDLAPYGYAGYSAWSTQPFMDSANSSVAKLWIWDSPAPFVQAAPATSYATVNVHISGDPSQTTIYYTRANSAFQTWGKVPVDPAGNFILSVPASAAGTTYLLRPVASDYDFYSEYGFDSIPRAVTVVPGGITDISFEGHPVGAGSVAIGRAQPALSQEALLPRSQRVSVKLYALLAADGLPAESWEEAGCIDLGGPLDSLLPTCALGAPVQGATVEFEILGGTKRLERGTSNFEASVVTDENGTATVMVAAGTHPGQLRVQARVVANPMNTFFEPTRNIEIEIHPDAEHDDADLFFRAPTVKPLLVLYPKGR